MPSWNLHIAHAERLLADDRPMARIVRDRNAFLFGNLVPDIYVGYMVPAVVRPIPYRITHFAKPEHIPKPREGEFWETYVAPLARELGCSLKDEPDAGVSALDAASLSAEVAHVAPTHAPDFSFDADPAETASLQVEAMQGQGAPSCALDMRRSLFDLVLGTWVHLLADTVWNQRVSDFLDALGERPNRGFRIKKQGDFDVFGKSLAIDLIPRVTPRLIETAARFPQYPIDAYSVVLAVGIAHETVRMNRLNGEPSYQLLTREFFDDTFAEVGATAERLLSERL